MNSVRMEWDEGGITIPLPANWRVRRLSPEFPPPLSVSELEESVKRDMITLKPIITAAEKVVLIVEDSSRITDTGRFIEQLADGLSALRGGEDGVELVLAAGAHGEILEEDLRRKTGNVRIPITIHNATVDSTLEKAGTSRSGVPLIFNRRVTAADLRLTVSTVNIHPMAGFSGGGKVLLPGVAGLETIEAFHRLPSGKPGLYQSPMRELINEVLALLPIQFSWHLLSRPTGEIIQIFSGPIEAVHTQAISALKKWAALPEPKERANLVLAGCRPFNQNLLGTFKAVAQLNRLLLPGGTLILFNEAKRGRGEHYWRNQPCVVETQKKDIAKLFRGNNVAVYSPDSEPEDFSDLFPQQFRHLRSDTELLSYIQPIIERINGSARVTVLPYAPVTLLNPF